MPFIIKRSGFYLIQKARPRLNALQLGVPTLEAEYVGSPSHEHVVRIDM
jgi:hypothetical protein